MLRASDILQQQQHGDTGMGRSSLRGELAENALGTLVTARQLERMGKRISNVQPDVVFALSWLELPYACGTDVESLNWPPSNVAESIPSPGRAPSENISMVQDPPSCGRAHGKTNKLKPRFLLCQARL